MLLADTTGQRKWEFSSAGRASALQAGCHRFEPCNSHQIHFMKIKCYGPVVQLVRTPACHAGGREFEPHPGRQQKGSTMYFLFVIFNFRYKKMPLWANSIM